MRVSKSTPRPQLLKSKVIYYYIARSAKRCARFVFGPANARFHFFSSLSKRSNCANQNFLWFADFLWHIYELCSKFEQNWLSLSRVMTLCASCRPPTSVVYLCVCVGAHSWDIFMCEPIWLKTWDRIDTPLELWGRKLFFEKNYFSLSYRSLKMSLGLFISCTLSPSLSR